MHNYLNYWTLYNYLNKTSGRCTITVSKLLNTVRLAKQTTERCTTKIVNAVQLPKQNTERCTITQTNYWTLQLLQITERCTITYTNYWTL